MRLAGGTIAGTAADKWGRKGPLMVSVLWFSLFAALSGFSTSYAMLFGLRALFGLGMGGEWAAGMPLVLEHWPTKLRGIASGLLLGGWYWGYLFAAAAFQFIYPLVATDNPDFAWRAMFWLCVIPALFTLWIRARCPRARCGSRASGRSRRAGRAAARRAQAVASRIFEPDMIGTTIRTTAVIGAFMCIYYSPQLLVPRRSCVKPAGRCCRISPRSTSAPLRAPLRSGACRKGGLGRRGAATINVIPRHRVVAAVSPHVRPIWLGVGAAMMGFFGMGVWGMAPGLQQRVVPHRSARRRPGLLLSRRSGDWRDDADRARLSQGPGLRDGQRDEPRDDPLGNCGDGHLARARDPRPGLQMMQDFHEIYAVRYAHHDRKAHDNYILGDPHDTNEPLAYFVWVIKGAGGTFVLDTGFDQAMAEKRGPHDLRPGGRGAERHRVNPDTVTDVVISHLHYDHCGNHSLVPAGAVSPAGPRDDVRHGRYMCHAHQRIPFEADDVADDGAARLRRARGVPQRRRAAGARLDGPSRGRPLDGAAVPARGDAARARGAGGRRHASSTRTSSRGASFRCATAWRKRWKATRRSSGWRIRRGTSCPATIPTC
jgi:MFS family permease